MTTTLAIGDVHGCLDELKALVEHFNKSFDDTVEKRIVFIGDYIDRGADSKGVIDYIQELEKLMSVIALMGNHEQMIVDAYFGDNHDEYEWTASYDHTLKSFGVESVSEIPKAYIQWMADRPYFRNDGLRTYVHAGIQRSLRLSMETQNPSYMIWARDEFMYDMRKDGGFVVHGHTPQFDPWPDFRGNRLNLDTAAVFGNVLTGAVFDDVNAYPTHFINHQGKVIDAVFKPNATEIRMGYK